MERHSWAFEFLITFELKKSPMNQLRLSLVFCALFISLLAAGQQKKFTFVAFGDMPYRVPNDYPKFERVIKTLNQEKPDFIYYLCGVDVLETDKLGKLSLSVKGCKERDQFVLQTCRDFNIPVMCSMGGGYSPDIKVIVDAHANTFRLAQEIYF